jgi:hypothetical protein
MVSENNDAPSPLRTGGVQEGSFTPLRFLTLCGNDHGYDASRYTACPGCGNFDRIMVETALSPAIFSKRIRAALAAMKVR